MSTREQRPTLVLGATGKTGRRVVARRRLRGTPVRPASRSSATPSDWSDPGTWDAALQGAEDTVRRSSREYTVEDGIDTVLGRPPRTFEDYVLRTAALGAWDR